MAESKAQGDLDLQALRLQVASFPDRIAASSTSQDEEEGIRKACSEISQSIYEYGAVGEFEGREDIPYVKEDFPKKAERAKDAMILMEEFLAVARESSCPVKALRTVSIHSLLLCLEHHEPSLWTDDDSIAQSNTLLKSMLKAPDCLDLPAFLTLKSDALEVTLLQSILEHCAIKLKRDHWKANPGLVAAFSACVFSVKFPHLSDHLERVLPLSLLIVDDYQPEHQVLGIRLLRHLIEHCSRTELGWLGRAEVMYDVLHKLLYTTEESVLAEVLPALRLCLSIVENPSTIPCWNRSRHDAVIRQILHAMQMEDKMKKRRIYAMNLPVYLEIHGIYIVNHFRVLLKVIYTYMEVPDSPGEETRFHILQAMNVALRVAWPRFCKYSMCMLQSHVRLIYQISVDESPTPDEVKAKLIESAVNNVVLLKRLEPDWVQDFIHNLALPNQMCHEAYEKILDA